MSGSPNERMEAVQQKLTKIMMAGCTCMTMTPELQYHSERCHFRLASEAALLLGNATLIGGIVATLPTGTMPGNPLPAGEPVPQRAQDNPTNLPESLGATVEEALKTALAVRGYRTDGDTLTLARRCHFMALEDRDLLGMQKALADRYKEQRDAARGKPNS